MISADLIAFAALVLSCIQFFWMIGLTISRGDTTLRNRIDGVVYDLNGLGQKVTALGAKVDGMPDHHDIGRVYEEIRKLTANVSGIGQALAGNTATLEALRETTRRMDTFLRDESHHG